MEEKVVGGGNRRRCKAPQAQGDAVLLGGSAAEHHPEVLEPRGEHRSAPGWALAALADEILGLHWLVENIEGHNRPCQAL